MSLVGITIGATNTKGVACADIMSGHSPTTINKTVTEYEGSWTIYAKPLGVRGAVNDTYMR